VIAALAVLIAGLVGLAIRSGAEARFRARPMAAAMFPVVGWSVVATLLGVVLGAVSASARVAERDGEPVASLARTHLLVRAGLVVTDDPRKVRGSPNPEALVIPARLAWIEPAITGRVRASARIVVFASGTDWLRLLPGQRITVTGKLSPARGGDLSAALLSARNESLTAEPAPWLQRVADGLRVGLRRACAPLPPEPGGLLPGLVVGDTGKLDPALADDFRATGMTHLYAVSGTNCAIVVGAVLLLCRYCRAGPRLAALASLIALGGFVVLARPSPSVLRAAVMTGLALTALAVGRQAAAVPALATAVIGLVVVDPGLAVDAGFALSVAATAGLLLLAPWLVGWLRRCHCPMWAAQALAAGIAAQVACAPIIAALTGTVSVIAIPVNLLAAPAVAPATVLGIVAVVLAPPWPPGAECAAWLASLPARWLIWLADHGAAMPAGVVPWPEGARGGLLLAAVSGAAALIGMIQRVRRVALAVVLSAAVGVLPVRFGFPGWPPANWIMVMCDVGQGDAIVLRAAPKQAVVVDAGPQPGPVRSCLRSLGIEIVPLLVITHCHSDHVGGLMGVLRGRSVATILLSAIGPEEAAESEGTDCSSLARAPSPPRRIARAADQYLAGAVHLEVLGPTSRFTGTRSDANNNSLVVRAEVNGHSILLTGDAEVEAQSALLTAGLGSKLSAEVLKVAHHGSSYQFDQFLDGVSPSVALVSVGRGNRLGHPSTRVLARLSSGGATIARTDLDGMIAITSHGAELALVTNRGRSGGRPP
jgi:competence protein ComEC